MDQGERAASAIEEAARAARWTGAHWAALAGGSPSDSASMFEALIGRMDPRLAQEALRRGWPLRFAALDPPWRAFACALDSARLGELLSGNLSGDDSGISELHRGERAALRMLCALRVFRESSLELGEADPKVNSLRRIKLGPWREFPEVGAPGISSDQEPSEGLRACGQSRIARAMAASTLRASSSQALGACLGAAALLGAAGALGAWVGLGSPALGLAGFAACAFALANGSAISAARRWRCKSLAEAALAAMGCPPSAAFEAAASEGMAEAARASGLPGAAEHAEQVALGLRTWAQLGAAERKGINRARSELGAASLAKPGAWLSGAERECLDRALNEASPSAAQARRPQGRAGSKRL